MYLGGAMIRTQGILREGQRRALEKLAQEQARSVSEVVRELLDVQLRVENERRLRDAARSLRDDYLNDPELTVYSEIEGDLFHEEVRSGESTSTHLSAPKSARHGLP
jgi:hypothetical protein